MSVHLQDHHLRIAEELVAKAHAHRGIAPLHLPDFWEKQQEAIADPWSESCPQVPLGIMMSAECVFAELEIPEDWYRLYHDDRYRADVCKRYNDKAQITVGKRLLNEELPDPRLKWPEIKALHDIFEAENVWQDESYWLHQAATDPAELEALLDRVEARLKNLRDFMLPQNWATEKQRLLSAGSEAPLYRGQRGPITFAMSVYGVENLIFLIVDQPDLAARFRDLILKTMLECARILDEEAGYTPENAPRGFGFADDNCAMLNAEMYQFFGYPILKGMFDRYAPAPDDRRGQHSDSDMAHLLPLLGKLDLKWVNFGPTLTVSEIREHLPNAVIQGQLAPFVFSRNQEVNMVAEFIRDYEMAGAEKGLVFATAGSINNGSRLTGMRLLMAAIQQYGQYS